MSEVQIIPLRLDELEAMRLCDVEGYEQIEAGARMRISRGTVQRLLKSGRAKTARAILESAALLIGDDANDEG